VSYMSVNCWMNNSTNLRRSRSQEYTLQHALSLVVEKSFVATYHIASKYLFHEFSLLAEIFSVLSHRMKDVLVTASAIESALDIE
jgi:hypothetical protein